MEPTVLAVVPARGNSKGIPRKNLVTLGGMPLLLHTLGVATEVGGIDRLVVSTEDKEVAAVAMEAGAEVIDRPGSLATDETSTEAVLLHVIDVLKGEGFTADYVVTLEPTSPLRSAALVTRCVELVLGDSELDGVVAVVETSSLVGRIGTGSRFSYLIPDQPRRRQQREPLYRESGAVYVTKTSSLIRFGSVVGGNLGAVPSTRLEALDINVPEDLMLAEALLTLRSGDRGDPL